MTALFILVGYLTLVGLIVLFLHAAKVGDRMADRGLARRHRP